MVLTGKAISFVTSPFHVPLRRIFRHGEPEDGVGACAQAWSLRDPEQASELKEAQRGGRRVQQDAGTLPKEGAESQKKDDIRVPPWKR